MIGVEIRRKAMQTMTLKVYLAHNNMTLKDFSKEVDFDRTYLSLVMSGKKHAGKRLAKYVDRATNGQVKLKTRLGKKDMESQSQENKDEHQQ
jgi:hypothetical protein